MSNQVERPEQQSGGHTPGPWRWEYEAATTTHRLIGGDGTVIYSRLSGEESEDADDDLVLAAPDLLAALGALGVIGNGYCFCSHDRDPDKADHQPECRDATAAIAKAVSP